MTPRNPMAGSGALPPTDAQPPQPAYNATAQIAAMMEQWRHRIDDNFAKMKVREWCVQQAVEALKEGPPLMGQDDQGQQSFAVVALASDILAFISQPFSNIFVPDDTGPSGENVDGGREP